MSDKLTSERLATIRADEAAWEEHCGMKRWGERGELLSHIAALEAERKAEMVELLTFAFNYKLDGLKNCHMTTAVVAAYLAQKENKDA